MRPRLRTFETPWGPVSRLGLFLSVAMVLFIWGNSLVPGTGSGSLSLAVVEALRGALHAAGLPNGWVTNLLVRKTAHFTEYAVLGVVVSSALLAGGPLRGRRLLVAAAVLMLVPSIDETIQLFVPGRCGAVTDVMIDCCGGATGTFIRTRFKRG